MTKVVLLTHFPDGRIVTPLKIAAAKAAALSFFPPLAAFTFCIVAAAFCLSALSVSCGDLFFFFGVPEGDFFDFLADTFAPGPGDERFVPAFVFVSFFGGFVLLDGCCGPYIDMCGLCGGWW